MSSLVIETLSPKIQIGYNPLAACLIVSADCAPSRRASSQQLLSTVVKSLSPISSTMQSATVTVPPPSKESPPPRSPSPKRARSAPPPLPSTPCVIARGAEGVVSLTTFLGRPAILKHRLPKPYRHPSLDARLTARRLAGEARALARLRRAGVRVPAVYSVDAKAGTVVMEFVPGRVLKAVLGAAGAEAACREVGVAVAGMHGEDLCHGDLTTSNVIVGEEGEICLIDFGLAAQSGDVEEKAVDIYVLERAIGATHPGTAAELVHAFLEGYCAGGEEDGCKVLARLEDVRARGRKRDMTG